MFNFAYAVAHTIVIYRDHNRSAASLAGEEYGKVDREETQKRMEDVVYWFVASVNPAFGNAATVVLRSYHCQGRRELQIPADCFPHLASISPLDVSDL